MRYWKHSRPHLGSGRMGYQYIKCMYVHTGQVVSWRSVHYTVDVNPIPKTWNRREFSVSNKTHMNTISLQFLASVIIVVVSVCPRPPQSLFDA